MAIEALYKVFALDGSVLLETPDIKEAKKAEKINDVTRSIMEIIKTGLPEGQEMSDETLISIAQNVVSHKKEITDLLKSFRASKSGTKGEEPKSGSDEPASESGGNAEGGTGKDPDTDPENENDAQE